MDRPQRARHRRQSPLRRLRAMRDRRLPLRPSRSRTRSQDRNRSKRFEAPGARTDLLQATENLDIAQTMSRFFSLRLSADRQRAQVRPDPGATATLSPAVTGEVPSLRRNSLTSSVQLVSAWSVTVATDKRHTSISEKSALRDRSTTGTTKVSRREAELRSEGQVLPSAWKSPEQVKISPVATKFHEMMRR